MSKTVIAIDPVTRLEGHLKVEVQVEDVLKALAGDSAHDPMFEEAIARANKGALKRVPTTTSASSPRLIVRFPAVLRWLRFS